MKKRRFLRFADSKKTLDTILKRSNNNFDLIRLIAALMVVFGHSFDLFRNNGYTEPIKDFLRDDYSGSLAVYVFFFLSGLFITASFVNSKSRYGFFVMRTFRIWPALIVCITLTVFVIGPSVTNYSLNEYFEFRSTWAYLVSDISLIKIKFYLPGVFATNYDPGPVNGSIWTLPLEIGCYFFVFVLGIFGVFKNKWYTAIVFCLILVIYIFNFKTFMDHTNRPVIFFIAGSFLYVFKKYVIIDYKVLIGLLLVSTLFFNIFLLYVVLIYGVLVFGSSSFFIKAKLPGDYSYGIYIYGFLVQQLLNHYIPGLTSYKSLLISIPSVILLGCLSWYFIENPSIKAGRKIIDGLTTKKS